MKKKKKRKKNVTCSLIIYLFINDACAAHSKAECASYTTNNCERKTTTAEEYATNCKTKTSKETFNGSYSWTQEKGTCSDKPFDHSSLGENKA